jgi:hypothetical protein
MRVTEELVFIHLFRQNPVFTSLHLKSPVHVVPPLVSNAMHNLSFKSASSFNELELALTRSSAAPALQASITQQIMPPSPL